MVGSRGRIGVGFLALALLLGACGGGSATTTPSGNPNPSTGSPTSIAGDYGCYYRGDPDSPQLGYELRQDGTFTMHSFEATVDNTTGTWSVQGDSGTFEVKGTKETFAIQGDYLVFAAHPPREWFVMSYDPPSSVTGFVCFRNPGRASPAP
jgi:hypothetical protein